MQFINFFYKDMLIQTRGLLKSTFEWEQEKSVHPAQLILFRHVVTSRKKSCQSNR